MYLPYLHEGLHLPLVPGAALGELCQPYLPPVPVVEHLQPVHHLVCFPRIVMSSKIVNTTVQNLTELTDVLVIVEIVRIISEPQKTYQTMQYCLLLELG